RQQRQPQCPVLHRRDQRRGKRAVRCHSRSSRRSEGKRRRRQRRLSAVTLPTHERLARLSFVFQSECPADIVGLVGQRQTHAPYWVRYQSGVSTLILLAIVGMIAHHYSNWPAPQIKNRSRSIKP